jgi:threonine/homoserine/homoserine lactone efflux protein
MQLLIVFLISFIVSFLGSMQPGPVNLAVLAASIQKEFRNAFFIAIGGSLPEFIFCFLALKAAKLFLSMQDFYFYFQIVLIVIFLAASLYLWFSKENATLKVTKQNGFLLGTLLASLNPQLILFWIMVVTYIHVNTELNLFLNLFTMTVFSLGSLFGAFFMHASLIYFSKSFLKISINTFAKYADKTISVILFFLAVLQTIKVSL